MHYLTLIPACARANFRGLIRTTQAMGGLKMNFDDIPQSAMGRIDLYLFNIEMIDLFKSVNKSFFEPIFEQPVQRGAILDIAVCLGQSKIAVISDDRVLKIWEFTPGRG